MPTFVIVASNKTPLLPGEIRAGGTITANNGDIFIVSPGANSTTTFAAGNGPGTTFEVRAAASNTNNFDLRFNANTNPDVRVSDGVNLSNV